jgi:hypothetical protein
MSLQKQIANPRLNYLQRKALHKKLVTLSIVHAEPVANESDFLSKDNNEINNLLNGAKFNLIDPLRVLTLFNKIKSSVRKLAK